MSFPDVRLAEVVYSSIYPDMARERIRDLTFELTLSGNSIVCDVSSDSYAKFRGFVTTLLRLIFVSTKIIDVVSNDEL